MTPEQIRLAAALVAAMDNDPVAQSDANSFGDWYEHLTDHLSELHLEKARQLTGVNADYAFN